MMAGNNFMIISNENDCLDTRVDLKTDCVKDEDDTETVSKELLVRINRHEKTS